MIGLIGSTLGVVSGVVGAYAIRLRWRRSKARVWWRGRRSPTSNHANIRSRRYYKCLAAFRRSECYSRTISGVESIRTITGTRAKEMTTVSRLEREGAIIELGKKANRENCRASSFSELKVDDEDLIGYRWGAEAGVEWWEK